MSAKQWIRQGFFPGVGENYAGAVWGSKDSLPAPPHRFLWSPTHLSNPAVRLEAAWWQTLRGGGNKQWSREGEEGLLEMDFRVLQVGLRPQKPHHTNTRTAK